MGMWFAGGTDENEKLDREATTKVLRRTFRRVRPYRNQAFRAAGLLVVFALTSLAGPLLVRRAIDNGLSVGDRGALNQSIIGYVIVAVLAYGSYRMAIATLARVGENFLRDLRTGVFDRILKQSMPFYDRENAGVLVSRMTSDIDSLQVLVQLGLLMFVTATLLLFTSLVTLIFLDPLLLVLCLMTMPFVALASVKFHRESNLAYLAVRERIGTTLTSLQEGISGVRVVQAFAREDVQIESFAETNNGLYRTHMRSVKIGAYYLPVVEMAGALSTALAVGLGGWMVRDGRITLETGAGNVEVTIADEESGSPVITMTQMRPQFGPWVDPELVAAVGCLDQQDILGTPRVVSTGLPFCVTILRDQEALSRVRLNLEALEMFRKIAGVGFDGRVMEPFWVTLSGATELGDTFSRLLMQPPLPAEDPFTGSATGAMASYLWAENSLKTPKFIAEQGHWLGRPGQALVNVLGPRDDISGVKVSGQGYVLMRGYLNL